MDALGDKTELAPIPEVKPIEIDVERAAMLVRAERQVVVDARMIRAAAERRTLIEQIDEWDPDWRDHYGTIESAEANYLRQREPRS